MTRWFTRTVAVALVSIGAAGSASADILLDTFAIPAAATPTLNTTLATTTNTPNALGAFLTTTLSRNMALTYASGVAGGTVSGVIGGGEFAFSTTSGVGSFATLTYTFTAPVNVNVNGIAIDFANVDSGSTPVGNMPINVLFTDNVGGTSTGSVSVAPADNFTTSIAVAGAANLSILKSITIGLNNNGVAAANQDRDFTMTEIRLLEPPPSNVIPAPPAIFLVGAAVPVLAVRRHLAKRKAALAA